MPNIRGAQRALDTFRGIGANSGKRDGRSDREAISDLMTDLMHLADKLAKDGDPDMVDGPDVLITARNNYEEETL